MGIETYTVKEAATICKCHQDTLYQAIKSYELEAYRIGREYIIFQNVLHDFIKSQSKQKLDEAKIWDYTSKKTQNIGMPMLKSVESELDALLTTKASEKRKKSMIKSNNN